MSRLQGWALSLIEDIIAGGEAVTLNGAATHRAVYVARGALRANGEAVAEDSMWYGRGEAAFEAGAAGAALWRWELRPADAAPHLLENGASRHKLTRPLAGPDADEVLLRGDSVAFPPGGCAYLHTHRGPGIRCLIEGGIRIDTDGRSTSYAPGGAWFEAGPDPVFAQAAEVPSRFVRVMVLPAELKGKSSISYVNADDLSKPKSQSYRGYLDTPIAL